MNETIRTAAISPLRQRMIDDMNVRRFSRETQRNYVRDVGRFATFLGRSPDTATPDDVRQFQIDQREAGVPTPTMNSIVSALRFFFTQTIDRPDLARKLVRAAHPRNLPVVLSRGEVVRLLNATTTVKYQAALSVAYGAGLRVAEVAALKVTDVDGERMLLRVERGKGGGYRNAMLPADLLTLLREWWKASAGRRRRCPRHPGPARSRPARHHCALHQGGHTHGARRDQPARQAWDACGPRHHWRGHSRQLRRCAPRSRSPTSCGPPVPPTVPPRPGT
jgi:integrase/recombinase XerD